MGINIDIMSSLRHCLCKGEALNIEKVGVRTCSSRKCDEDLHCSLCTLRLNRRCYLQALS